MSFLAKPSDKGIKNPRLTFVWTEVIHNIVPVKLVSGLTFKRKVILGGINHYSDGKKEYFDQDHKPVSKEYIDACKEIQRISHVSNRSPELLEGQTV